MSGPSFNDNNTQQQQQKNLNSMKKNLTLDFNQSKLNLNNTFTSDLNMIKVDTPELNLLKVDTPTIENIILANGLPNTPSPSILFPRTVTAEQETFAGGFVEALNNLHNNGNSQNSSDTNSSVFSTNNSNTNGNTSNNNSTTNEPTSFLPIIKEEPQTVPNINNNNNNTNNNNNNNVNTPPMSPVDMEYQERMKLERKRQRNRLAASKCRSRKLERISKLEDKVKLLKSENAELSSVINQLKEHVGLLKLEVMEHANAGCPIMGTSY